MDEPLGRQSGFNEAKALFRMVGDEHTVEELRKLIAVPAWIERVLLDYAGEFPEDACWIGNALRFREATLCEFERLLAEGVPVAEVPEDEEAGLEHFTEAVPLHCQNPHGESSALG